MRDELIAAVDWWEQVENTNSHSSPFVEENPNYVISAYEQEDALRGERTAVFEAGKSAGKNGDTYNLVTVFLAASLFVLGIARVFRAALTRIAAIGIGTALSVGATIWMLTLPVAG